MVTFAFSGARLDRALRVDSTANPSGTTVTHYTCPSGVVATIDFSLVDLSGVSTATSSVFVSFGIQKNSGRRSFFFTYNNNFSDTDILTSQDGGQPGLAVFGANAGSGKNAASVIQKGTGITREIGTNDGLATRDSFLDKEVILYPGDRIVTVGSGSTTGNVIVEFTALEYVVTTA